MLKLTFPLVGGSWIYMLLIFNACYYLGYISLKTVSLVDRKSKKYTEILEEHKNVWQIWTILSCDVYKRILSCRQTVSVTRSSSALSPPIVTEEMFIYPMIVNAVSSSVCKTHRQYKKVKPG